MKLTTTLSAAVLCAACATPSTMMVGVDGNVTRCSASGWGYIGAPMALSAHEKCVSDLRSAGAVPLAEAGSVGIIPSTERSLMFILKVLPGSPAQAAGIKAGDSLLAVDDQHVSNWGDARRLMSGPVNTPVRVTLRSGTEERTVSMLRGPAVVLPH